MFRVVGRIVAFVAIALVSLGVLFIGASAIGFLVYSDRPGPGFYGPRFALDLAEVKFLLSFLGFLVVPFLFVGSVVLAVELIYVRVRLPSASIRLVGALAAGLFTGLVTASMGWYIALAGEAAGLALVVGALAAFVMLPRRLSLSVRPKSWASLARGVVLTIAGIPLALAPFAILTALLFNVRGPVRYDIPDGYRGWVVVRYEQESCQALPLRGVDLVVAIDQHGCGCSSSDEPWSGTWRDARYAYVSDGVTRDLRAAVQPNSNDTIVDASGEIWGISKGRIQYAGEKSSRGYDAFYVGTGPDYLARGDRSAEEDMCRRR
jgi:hypothetical protein